MSDDDATLPVQPPDPKARPVRAFGGYEIVSELGRGGMGIVYRARQARLNRLVALKMLTGHFGREELARFVAEAETVARLQHTNIVHIYEVGDTEGVPFFAMEFIEGGTLAERLRARPPSAREAAELMLPVARAVHFAHEHGVVHRDLKPGNVLLDTDGVPKVVDFGIAKRLGDDTSLTVSGAIIGTPIYMAPEQAKGSSRDAGPGADVYSLGAILYEMLTGRPPFLPDESDTALMVRVVTEDPVSPAYHRPDIPRDVEAICVKCLHKDPRDRYASAAALAEDLRRFLADEPILAKPPTRIRRTVKWVRRHPWRAVSYAAACMMTGAALQRAWQWDQQERVFVEYGLMAEFRNGNAAPFALRDAAAARRAAVSVRFERRGRAGTIVRAEVLNPRGHPAATRWVQGYDVIPSWLEGVSSGTLEGERRETVSLDFSSENGQAVEVTARERNGVIVWRMHFDRQLGVLPEGAVRARFMRQSGYDDTMPSGASHAVIERDAAGWDRRVTFSDSQGNPARNGDGVFGYAIERDAQGRGTRLTHLDKEGRPMPSRLGIIAMTAAYAPDGPVREARFVDGEGRPAPVRGIATLVSEFDAIGNPVKLSRLGADGKLTNSTGTGLDRFAVVEHTRNERGEPVETRYLAVGADGGLALIARTILAFDDNGYVAEMRSLGAAGGLISHHFYRNDERGNVLEDKSVDEDGDVDEWERYTLDAAGRRTLVESLDEAGAVESRRIMVFENDRLKSETREAPDGTPATADDGHSSVTYEYHKTQGYRLQGVFSGYAPPNPPRRAVTYNEHGLVIEEQWQDAAGNVVSGPRGWARRTCVPTADGLGIESETLADASGRPAPGSEGWSQARYRRAAATGMVEEKIFSGFADAKGPASRVHKLDARGNLIEDAWRDAGDQLVAGPEGWARCSIGYDETGAEVERAFFAADGAIAYHPDGHHRVRIIRRGGIQVGLVHEEFEPARFKNAFHRIVIQSPQGEEHNALRNITHWEDKDGARVCGPGGCMEIDITLDDEMRDVLHIEAGYSPELTGAPVWQTTSEYGEGKSPLRTVQQALDEQRRPLTRLVTGGAARTEKQFDAQGVLRASVETGFDEARLGYARREAKFNDDSLFESATLRRGDGSEIARVGCFIRLIAPQHQPQVEQLRVGDQLVAVAGRDIVSALAFVMGPRFPGGALEVLRDGQRVKVDGLEPGMIGIYVEDRALPAP